MPKRPEPPAAAVLAALVAVAVAVRAVLFRAPLYLDEAYSGLAVRGILDSGLPFFPSGLYYDRDLPYHYLVAGAMAVFGDSEAIARAVSVGPALALVPATYLLVREVLGERTPALVAAAVVALDPWSASMSARIRMYPFFQLATVLALWAFYADWLGPRASERRWKVRSAVAMAAGVLAHHLFLFFGPAFALLAVLGMVRQKRVPWLAALIALVAVVAAVKGPSMVQAIAVDAPAYRGAVVWGGDDHSAQVNAHFEALGPVDNLAEKYRTSAPSRPGSQARGLFLLFALVASAWLLRRRGGLVFGATVLVPLVLIVLYPRHELPGRWLVHLAPLGCALLAAGAWKLAGRSEARWSALGLIALAGATTSAVAVGLHGTPAWSLRYPGVVVALTASGIAWVRSRSRGEGLDFASIGAAAASVVIVATMPLALWWVDGGAWAERASALRAQIRPGDRVIVDGDNAPTVYWSLGRVDGVLPSWRVEYAGLGDGERPYELATGAPLIDAESAAQDQPTWILHPCASVRGTSLDATYDAAHAAPLRDILWRETAPTALPAAASAEGPCVRAPRGR